MPWTYKGNSYILVIAVAVAVSVVCVSVIAFSYYIVTDSNLVLALGVIRSKTPLKNVTEVTYFKKQKKLVLYYADNDNSPESYTVIVIDDKHIDGFVTALRKANPKIVYENSFSA